MRGVFFGRYEACRPAESDHTRRHTDIAIARKTHGGIDADPAGRGTPARGRAWLGSGRLVDAGRPPAPDPRQAHTAGPA
jgi:hypothetical protein